VYVHGHTGFYLGCGSPKGVAGVSGVTYGGAYHDGPGFGITGDPDAGIYIGRLFQANHFTSPEPDNTASIQISGTQVVMKHLDADITIASHEVSVGKNSKRVNIG
jgi:hypothetical protein